MQQGFTSAGRELAMGARASRRHPSRLRSGRRSTLLGTAAPVQRANGMHGLPSPVPGSALADERISRCGIGEGK